MARDGKHKFCPECGSHDIDWVLPQTWSKWQCKACGYIGALVVEDGDMAEVIRKDHEAKLRKGD